MSDKGFPLNVAESEFKLFSNQSPSPLRQKIWKDFKPAMPRCHPIKFLCKLDIGICPGNLSDRNAVSQAWNTVYLTDSLDFWIAPIKSLPEAWFMGWNIIGFTLSIANGTSIHLSFLWRNMDLKMVYSTRIWKKINVSHHCMLDTKHIFDSFISGSHLGCSFLYG